MGWAEPRRWYDARNEEQKRLYPELNLATPDEVSQVDAYRIQRGELPSQMTIDTTATAATLARQRAGTDLAPQPLDNGYGPLGPMGPVAPTPSTGDPGLGSRLAGMAAGFGDRNISQAGAGESLANLGRVAGVGAELATSPYASALGLPDNPVTQEITRPVNWIPIGKGVTAARAVTEAVGGRLAVEAAQPLVEKLPESWQGAADLGLNIAGQVATGAAYGRAGGALGMGIKNVGDDDARAATDVADDVAGGARYEPPPTLRRLFGVGDVQEGTQRGILERVGTEGRFRPDDPIVTPALRVRDEARQAVTNQATRVTAQARTLIKRAGFDLDDTGRVKSLAGIDPTVPGAPTLRDVAARYPRYAPYLTDQQRQALESVRNLVAPYRQALDEVVTAETQITGKPSSIKFGSRPDVMEGGFYIPRGNAETDELADIASQRVARGGGRPGKQGFEKSATFASEAEGIDAGYKYTPIDESLESYVKGSGNRALDRHTANYFLTRVDESGKRLAESRADRLDPELRGTVDALRQRIAGRLQTLRNQTVRETAQERAARETARASERITDSGAALSAAERDLLELEQLATGRLVGTAKRRKATQDAVAAFRAELDAIKPRYQRAQELAASTPRDQGSIPLRGLEAYSFPWEMADEAARILQRENVQPGQMGASLRAVNSVARGVQATGEMSYLGIQNAIGSVADPVGFGRSANASTRAWLNSGDEVLGDYLMRFDAKAAQKGLPTTERWAASGLRLAESGTEFKVGRKMPAAVEAVTNAPGVKQALAVPKSLVKRADRGFGVAGDTMRLELADTLAEESLLAGRTLDAAELKKIAESANRATGWTPQRAFGDWGEALNFAPRYLAARVRTLGQLASADPRKRQLARRLVGRYIAFGTTATIAANYLHGEETDFRPFSGKNGPTFDPREAEYKNPNFMRVMNVANRDWSLLGPVDATLGLAIGLTSLATNPTGDPKEALDRLRSIITGPLASAGLDWFVFGEDFDGNKLTLDSPEGQKDILRRIVPFAAPDLAESAIETAGADTAIEGAAEVAGGIGQGFLGGRASRLTPRERVERGQYEDLKPADQLEAHRTQSWQEVSQAFGSEMSGDAGTYGQWRERQVDYLKGEFRRAGLSEAQSVTMAEDTVDKLPVSTVYGQVRNAREDQWALEHLKEAADLLDKESRLPERDRLFHPSPDVRAVIEGSRG